VFLRQRGMAHIVFSPAPRCRKDTNSLHCRSHTLLPKPYNYQAAPTA
jgi:hypothetical protein